MKKWALCLGVVFIFLTGCVTGKTQELAYAMPVSFDGYELSHPVHDGELIRVQGFLMLNYLISDREGDC